MTDDQQQSGTTSDDLPLRWADRAQFHQKPFGRVDPSSGVQPKVSLLWMTPDPLGAIAAMCRMYEGKVTPDMEDITASERAHYWRQAQATHLKAPLEAVKFHFFIEGVDRAFTHQMVRQRTAVYAQESMRFAVVDDLSQGTTLPPSLYGTEPGPGADLGVHPDKDPRQRWRNKWDETLDHISATYAYLVNDGMPAEEARGLLPHATATRLNYITDLRALLDHAGNRLCTQAQFHWRMVFTLMAKAIREYPNTSGQKVVGFEDDWQFQELSRVFRPVCYEANRCPFQASFDRGCTIRDRVQANAAAGIGSKHWDANDPIWQEEAGPDAQGTGPIDPAEWAMNPGAARER